MAAQQRRGRELQHGAGDVVGVGPAEHPGVAVLDQRGRAALGDRDDRQAAGAGLEHDLAVGVGGRAEEEDVGAGVGARQVLALEPAEEGRALAEPRPQLALLGPAAGEQQVQPRVGLVRPQEALGEQVDPLLAGQATGVENLDLARVVLAGGLAGVEAGDVDAALPAPEPGRVDAEREQRAVRRRARREHQRGRAVEGAQRHPRHRLDAAVAAAQAGVGAELGVVAGDQRRAGDPVEQRRGDPGRAGRGDVDGVVAPLGERLDQVGQAGDAEPHPGVEGDLELGGRRQPPIDAGVGADHLDLEAGHPELADLLDRRGDAVHRPDPVGDQRHPRPLAGPGGELRLLGAEEGGGRRVGHGRDERVEEAAEGGADVAPSRRRGPSATAPRRRRSWVRRARR